MKKEYFESIKQMLPVLRQMQETIESYADEEQEKFDSLSERAQESEKGEAMEDLIYNLQDASSSLEDAIDSLEEVIDV